MDPFKLPANTFYNLPTRFLPDTYHPGFSLPPINPYTGRNMPLPIPQFEINRYDVMNVVDKKAGGSARKRKR